MYRDISKLVEDYYKHTQKNRHNRGAFFASDIQQVYDIAKTPEGIKLFTAIATALQAGYMVGYKSAKRETGKRGTAY